MDAKDLRTDAAIGDRSNDGNTKYMHIGGSLPCHRNKTYQEIGSSSLGKVDGQPTRPCAVIGPDRVVPPTPLNDSYLKKAPTEPWLGPDTERRPPDYPYKLLDYQLPTRNISPRQTFQENMQRIMVPPSYNAVKMKEDYNLPGDPASSQMRNNKLSVTTDTTKYCDVPYSVNSLTNDQKIVRNPDISASNVNSVLARSAPHAWPPTGSNVRPPPKPYPQELCQYPEYPSCAGPRPMLMPRQHRTVHPEASLTYSDPFYHDGNIRYKPYPTMKERYPQPRYEYIANYPSQFHPPPPFPHKYDLQKSLPPHPYSSYQQIPLKYLESRLDSVVNGYQRPLNPQASYNNMPLRNQVIHPTYGPIPENCLQPNKFYPYPADSSKPITSSKLPYDPNSQMYPDFENNRNKTYPMSDGFYINEMARSQNMKGQVLPPNYPTNLHAMPTHPYYRKENMPIKGFEYNPNFRNIDPMHNYGINPLSRFPTQFSPTTVAISPSDSSTSNDTNQTHGTSQEDCGYVSQASTNSIRSMDSSMNRLPSDVYRRYDHLYAPIIKQTPTRMKPNPNIGSHSSAREKKDIDVRQFLQMWNEGEDEGNENNVGKSNINNSKEEARQEQLYVLGLVNVPSEELAKYEHIQKVSKLPENIKGYNNIELLHQFEEVIESSNLNVKPPTPKEYRSAIKSSVPLHSISIPSRPLSPLDVEAKISQSIIHKDVGCNFEIKPCSPKMLNVDVATPVQRVMEERRIEKVSNPLLVQSPILHQLDDARNDCNILKCQDISNALDNTNIASCKMVSTKYAINESVNNTKSNYSIQDLESNSGVCLASLPRLDNDIELNFPEVNQQFINANKAGSVITSTSLKDLPQLDIEQSSESVDQNIIDTDKHDTQKSNIDNDFSKLSKYRKLKKKESTPNIPESDIQGMRTDSVIIKNPESFEGNKYKTSPKSFQEDPINLSVNTEHREDITKISATMDNYSYDNESAIDFSLNTNEIFKSNSLSNFEYDMSRQSFIDHDIIATKEQHVPKESGHTVLKTQKSATLENADIVNIDESGNENISTNNSRQNIILLASPSFAPIIDPSDNVVTTNTIVSKTLNTSILSTDCELKLNENNVTNNNQTNIGGSPMSLDVEDKDDNINEKMREIFGEITSDDKSYSVDTEHDTSIYYSEEEDGALSFKDKQIEIYTESKVNVQPEHLKIDENQPRSKPLEYLATTKSDIENNEENLMECDAENPIFNKKENSVKLAVCNLRKELLSPWIQNLLIFSEGVITRNNAESSNIEYTKDRKEISDTAVTPIQANLEEINYTEKPYLSEVNHNEIHSEPNQLECDANSELDFMTENKSECDNTRSPAELYSGHKINNLENEIQQLNPSASFLDNADINISLETSPLRKNDNCNSPNIDLDLESEHEGKLNEDIDDSGSLDKLQETPCYHRHSNSPLLITSKLTGDIDENVKIKCEDSKVTVDKSVTSDEDNVTCDPTHDINIESNEGETRIKGDHILETATEAIVVHNFEIDEKKKSVLTRVLIF